MTQNILTPEQEYIANFSNGILLVEHGNACDYEEAIVAKALNAINDGMSSRKILFLSCGTSATRLRGVVSELGCELTVATIEEICLSKVFNQRSQSFLEDQQAIYQSTDLIFDKVLATLNRNNIFTEAYLAKTSEAFQNDNCLLKGSPYQALFQSLCNLTDTHSKCYHDIVADALALNDANNCIIDYISKAYNLLIVEDFQDATMLDVHFLMTLKDIETVIIGGDPRQNLNRDYAHSSQYPKAWVRFENLASPKKVSLNNLSTHAECDAILNLIQTEIGLKNIPLLKSEKFKGSNSCKPQMWFLNNHEDQMQIIASYIESFKEQGRLGDLLICTYANSDLEIIANKLHNWQIDVPLNYCGYQSEFEFCTTLINKLLVIASGYAAQKDASDKELIETLLTFVDMPNVALEYAGNCLMSRHKSAPRLKCESVATIKFKRAKSLYEAFFSMLKRPQISTGIHILLDSLVPVLKEYGQVKPDHIDRYLKNVQAVLGLFGSFSDYKAHDLQTQMQQQSLLLTTCTDAINYDCRSKIIVNLTPGKLSASLTNSTWDREQKFAQQLFYKLLAQSTYGFALIFRKDLHRPNSYNNRYPINKNTFYESDYMYDFKDLFGLMLPRSSSL